MRLQHYIQKQTQNLFTKPIMANRAVAIILSIVILIFSIDIAFAGRIYINMGNHSYCHPVNLSRKETDVLCDASRKDADVKFVKIDNVPEGYRSLFLDVYENKIAIVKEDMSEKVAYGIVKAVYDHYDVVIKLSPNHPQNADKMTMINVGRTTLHQGALKFYKERNLL